MNFLLFLSWNFKPIFVLTFFGLLISGLLTHRDNYLVTTQHAPQGIVSWEVNTSNIIRNSIIKDWKWRHKTVLVYKDESTPEKKTITGLTTAISQNYADFVFIIFYVGFLLLLLNRLDRSTFITKALRSLNRILAILTVIVGVLDCVENIGTLIILTSADKNRAIWYDAGNVGYPSRIKWLILIVVILTLLVESILLKVSQSWLALLSVGLNRIVVLTWRFRAVLIALFIVFLILHLSDQGQDLLLSLTATKPGTAWFLATTTIIALLCWHLPKAIDNAKTLRYSQFWSGPTDFSDTVKKKLKDKIDFARLLGAAGFLIPATGILKVMDNYHMDYAFAGVPPLAILLSLLALYALILNQHWIDRFYKSTNSNADVKWLKLVVTLLVLLAPAVYWGFAEDEQQKEPHFIVYVALDLIIFSVIFLIITTLRTCIPAIKKTPVAPVITFTGLACLLLFIACNWPNFLHHFIDNSRFYTMPFVFCAIAGYLLVFSFLLFIGKKTGIQWVTLILVFTFYKAATTVTNYHRIAILNDKPAYTKSLDSLTSYTKNWLLYRENEIAEYPKNNKGRKYPVFFINAHGGGIRAAVWTTMVIGNLDKILRADTNRSNKAGFQHYAFSYSGASGGTIGLMLLCGDRYQHSQKDTADKLFKNDVSLYPTESKNLYATDNLTSDIIALFGRDMLWSSFGLSGIEDRARLMEQDWEFNAGKRNVVLGNKIGEVWKNSNTNIPLLFSNTYDVNSGNKGIVAPVLMDPTDFPSAIFIEQRIKDPGDLRLSTAGFLSARFPYVSPTGKLDGLHHFTDGGTIENSGAETSLQIVKVFKRVIEELLPKHAALANISLNLLSLPNGVKGISSPEYDKGFYEPLAPPLGLFNLGNANEDRAELTNEYLQKQLKYTYLTFQPGYYKVPKKQVWPVLPLGWQISDIALDALENSANRDSSDLDSIVKLFGIKRENRIAVQRH